MNYQRILKTVGHTATLLFAAFWLVATSSDRQPIPARDCFTGIPNSVALSVVLGTPSVATDGGSSPPGCQGLDGLAPGSSIVFNLSQGSRPQTTDGACYGYTTASIAGTMDVTLGAPNQPYRDYSLTVADGDFSSSQSPGCRGNWSLSLRPAAAPADGQLVSPLTASDTDRWYVGRVIDIDQAQACGAAFAQTGPILCQDLFPVVSITQVGP